MRPLLFLSLLLLTSCSFFIKKIGGIKNPKIETFHSINEYSKKLAIDSAHIVFAKDSTSLFELNKIFIDCPEILIFSQSKQFLPYKNDSIRCNGPIGNILRNICNINSNDIISRRKINYDTLGFLFIDPNNCLSSFNIKDFDYVVFVNYAKFADGVNKTHIIPWNTIIKDNKPTCKVKYIYVDLDYLNTWGIKKSSLPRLKIKAT